MVKPRPKPAKKPALKNQRRSSPSLVAAVSSANRRAHEQANRKACRRGLKSVRAAIAATEPVEEEEIEWPGRVLRWGLALVLLPLCWVTSWTFLSQFSQATVQGDFWQSPEFWYFATGGLVMIGWFWSGLLQSLFLYLYVLGHELTHAAFVVMFRGKVTDFYVSAEGGYITTNKTNWMIALSPYFVPFWSVVVAVLYLGLRWMVDLPPGWDRALYGLMGLTWTFHMVWTLWMIPRDQPDLKENGTFLSLVVIYFANLLLLVALLCIAAEAPVDSAQDFGREWLRHAATWGDQIYRKGNEVVGQVRELGRFR